MIFFYIFLTIFLLAFFSGMEIAFVASNKLKMEIDKQRFAPFSKVIGIFSKNPTRYHTTMLLGYNIVLVTYGILMATLLEPAIAGYFSSNFGLMLALTLIATLIILIFAEFLPKALVRIEPNLLLQVLALPLLIVYILLYPLAYVVVGTISFMQKGFFKKWAQPDKGKVFTPVDLYHLVNYTGSEIKSASSFADELQLFKNAMEFTVIKVRDCMIPRTEITAMEVNTSIEELKQKFVETGFSKIPIYEHDFDNVIGYITSKELFKKPQKIRNQLIPISFVPGTMAAKTLLYKLMQEHKSMALVVDEFGGISGLITIEDIIEEIFGEIQDEHDNIALTEKKVSETEYLFAGRLEIETINEKYKLKIPENDEYDTLAGFIFYHFESIPKIHDVIVIDKFQFKILKGSKTKIELVQLTLLP